jgi:amidase
MRGNMTRREALKLGTSTAISAAAGPLLSSSIAGAAGVASSSADEICYMRAVDMVAAIRTRKLSSREVMQAHLKQIGSVNAKVNAMVTMVPEDQLMAQAAAADEALANGKWLGPLHGLPVAVKDLHETHGIRTTYGSPLHKNNVPDFDCRVVQREKEAGAIVLGKTNVPEFGLGSQTFNPVFGPTHNPYDTTKTCGGSTGGGAVAVACAMAPLADGSDMGG